MTLSLAAVVRLGAAVCSALLSAFGPAAAARAYLGEEWTSLVHPQRGFAISYPASVFEPKPVTAADEGRIFVSRDGQATLLVGAFDNTGDFSLDSYRRFLLEQNYTGAVLDYDRRKANWFVISGTRGNTMFYERVTFVCGGRLINTWAMLYPVAERRLYDRIVEQVAHSYSPGSGQAGDCR